LICAGRDLHADIGPPDTIPEGWAGNPPMTQAERAADDRRHLRRKRREVRDAKVAVREARCLYRYHLDELRKLKLDALYGPVPRGDLEYRKRSVAFARQVLAEKRDQLSWAKERLEWAADTVSVDRISSPTA